MKYDMVMPKMGESITEGTIIKWLKQPGDTVEKDEIILEISTDKVDSEIPTPVAGKISEILAGEGDTIEVGKTIARIETEAKAEITPQVEEEKTEPEKDTKTEPKVEVKQKPTPEVMQEETASTRFYSPVVLNIARTEGLAKHELDDIPGTGINGRVTKKDVLNYLESRTTMDTKIAAPSTAPSPPPVGGVEVVPMDHIRKKIAEHMVQTVHTSPHVGLFIEVDMTNIAVIREQNKDAFYKKEGIKLTYMPFISEATTKTLKEFPYVNASLDGNNILIKHFINLGIAVATDQGLIVPVIKNADSLNLVGLARAINDLATRARIRKLKPDEVTQGTFSISNFGVYGTTIGFPLINQPQVAILGIGVLEKRAVVLNDAIAMRPMMNISLTFDHRLIDGALGAQFLQRIKQHLEDYHTDSLV
jgi:2-oxoglutarate dehydrogenase complex dihydrolipoamide succinyltransferase (E2) component